MSSELWPLVTIAAVTGIVHTIMGPDHYLPFIALSKSQSWTIRKTAWITFWCGVGHLLSAVVLGFLALGLRFSLDSLNLIESARSDLAAWGLIAFGLVYMIWGMKRAYGRRETSQAPQQPFLWVLFIIFVIGPCEPLFILMTYPSVIHSYVHMAVLIGVFGTATLATMLSVVLTAAYGLNVIRFRPLSRVAPVLTGFVVMCCGLGIKFLGL